jgi:hypothetical protein
MPCQSYDDDWNRERDDAKKIKALKAQADMLARIACKALTELEKNEIEDLLLLKDDEVRTWWTKHKEDDRKEQARLAEIERKARVKAEALARLSDEEKELLGLAPKKSQSKNSGSKGHKILGRSATVVNIERILSELEDKYSQSTDWDDEDK